MREVLLATAHLRAVPSVARAMRSARGRLAEGRRAAEAGRRSAAASRLQRGWRRRVKAEQACAEARIARLVEETEEPAWLRLAWKAVVAPEVKQRIVAEVATQCSLAYRRLPIGVDVPTQTEARPVDEVGVQTGRLVAAEVGVRTAAEARLEVGTQAGGAESTEAVVQTVALSVAEAETQAGGAVTVEAVVQTEERSVAEVAAQAGGAEVVEAALWAEAAGVTAPAAQRAAGGMVLGEAQLSALNRAVRLVPLGTGGRQRRERRAGQQQQERDATVALLLQAESRMAAAIGRGAEWPAVVAERLEVARARWLEAREGTAAFVGADQGEQRFLAAAARRGVRVGVA